MVDHTAPSGARRIDMKEAAFIKEVFGKILDLNNRNDGVLYTPSVSLYARKKYTFLMSCYLEHAEFGITRSVQLFREDTKSFFEDINLVSKGLIIEMDEMRGRLAPTPKTPTPKTPTPETDTPDIETIIDPSPSTTRSTP